MQIKIPKPELIPISKLRRNPKNIKLHPKEQIHDLIKLMEMVGFKDPIVIDREYNIWAGHGRLDAAEILKMDKAPCIFLDDLSEEQKKVFLLMDNKVNESDWVKENVQLIFDEISPAAFDDFEMTFPDYMISDVLTVGNTSPPQAAPKVTSPGEIWEMGSHKLLCGDNKEPKNYQALLGDQKVHQLNTDPPYGIDYASKNEFVVKQVGGRSHEYYGSDDSKTDYRAWFNDIFKNIPFAKYNTVYIWTGSPKLHEIREAMIDSDVYFSIFIVWAKDRMVFGRKDYYPKHELCIYGWKGTHKFYAEDTRETILEYKRPNSSGIHPTSKPVELITQLVQDGTKKGDNVLDIFAGSGSSLIACEATGRNWYGMELEPAYCDAIIQRWETVTGLKAKKSAKSMVPVREIKA